MALNRNRIFLLECARWSVKHHSASIIAEDSATVSPGIGCILYRVGRGVKKSLGLAVLVHELLGGACGNMEDLQDIRIEIPRWHFGFECSQQLTNFHRTMQGPPYARAPRWASELWMLVIGCWSLRRARVGLITGRGKKKAVRTSTAWHEG
jgi:hypothetical protein